MQHMADGFVNQKTFDALGAPFGADFSAWKTPYLFGVGLEEGLIQAAAEAIDEELFEIVFRAYGKQRDDAVGILHNGGLIGDSSGFAVIGDADAGWGVRFERKNVEPPVHDAAGLGEEAMAADIDSVTFVIDGAGNVSKILMMMARLVDDVVILKPFSRH